MGIRTRRAFRLSIVAALALACGYGLKLQLPYLAPMLAIILTAKPSPPPGPMKLLLLVIAVTATLTSATLLIPYLEYYPFAGILIVSLVMYGSFHLSVVQGKEAVGHFIATGFSLVPIAGSVSSTLANLVIESLILGVVIAVVCQWLVYPFFPEDPEPENTEKSVNPREGNRSWNALRGTLIVMPAYLVVLTNPGLYLPLVLKSIVLGQQSSVINVRKSGHELLGATILGGFFAVLLWWFLSLSVSLWMFFLWALIFMTFISGKIYGVLETRFPASFWQSVSTTMMILLGAAVMDSENGKDVYQAFLTRVSLFLLVSLYSWFAVYVLDRLSGINSEKETAPC